MFILNLVGFIVVLVMLDDLRRKIMADKVELDEKIAELVQKVADHAAAVTAEFAALEAKIEELGHGPDLAAEVASLQGAIDALGAVVVPPTP